MEQIIIKQNDNKTFTIEQGDKISYECNWTGMMGLLAALTMPDDRPYLQWMKERSYKPKDGDFVYVKTSLGDSEFIFIKKEGLYITNKYISYVFDPGTFFYDDKRIVCINDHIITIRPATKEEKQLLLDALHKDGKDWDAENRQIVDYKWKPKIGTYIHYPHFNNEFNQFVILTRVWKENDMYLHLLLKKGWIFQTFKESQEFCNKLNKTIKNVK